MSTKYNLSEYKEDVHLSKVIIQDLTPIFKLYPHFARYYNMLPQGRKMTIKDVGRYAYRPRPLVYKENMNFDTSFDTYNCVIVHVDDTHVYVICNDWPIKYENWPIMETLPTWDVPKSDNELMKHTQYLYNVPKMDELLYRIDRFGLYKQPFNDSAHISIVIMTDMIDRTMDYLKHKFTRSQSLSFVFWA